MKMIKKRVAELEGAQLDWAVNKARGLMCGALGVAPGYSTYWGDGGPIVGHHIHTLIERNGEWTAEAFWPHHPNPRRFCYSLKGPTALIAAMRTFVASRLGAEVEVPE